MLFVLPTSSLKVFRLRVVLGLPFRNDDSSYRRTHNKYQLSLTNPHDALHNGKRCANKGGRSVR